MMWTAADDVAWVAKCQAAMERLRSGVTARGSGPAEAVPGDAGLEVPGAGGSEPGSIATTQAIVEALRLKHPPMMWGERMLRSLRRW
jgi:hypothetical protein